MIATRLLHPDDFADDAWLVAPRLIGAWLLIHGVGGRIVEVEAYDHNDPAAHSFRGPTAANQAMFGPPGRAYVYRSYGIHLCLNLVCREVGHGAGVLIRAIEPVHGIEQMRHRRHLNAMRQLCSGPGRVGQALAVALAMNGQRVDQAPFAVHAAEASPEIVCGPRIGISKAVEQPWRFGLAGSAFLSRPFRPS